MQNEIWKDVIGYEGYYVVSNIGRVKSLQRTRRGNGNSIVQVPERILRYKIDTYGYRVYTLSKQNVLKSHTCHRIVAKSFIPNPNNHDQVNHINGIKTDNNVKNLEWCNNSYNQKEAYRIGLNKARKSKDNTLSKKVAKIKDGVVIKVYDCITDASKDNKVAKTAISNCLNGRSKTSCNHSWVYL